MFHVKQISRCFTDVSRETCRAMCAPGPRPRTPASPLILKIAGFHKPGSIVTLARMSANRPVANPGTLAALEARLEAVEADNRLLLRLLASPAQLQQAAETYKTLAGLTADMLGMIKLMQDKGLRTVSRGMEGPPAPEKEVPLEERLQNLVGIMAGGAAAAAEAMGADNAAGG